MKSVDKSGGMVYNEYIKNEETKTVAPVLDYFFCPKK